MNTSNSAAKFDSIVHRNLHRKNVNLRPFHLPSLLGVTMGVLMLMAMAAPSAHAAFHLLTYYDFEDGTFTSDAPGEQNTTISFTPTSYPGGNLTIEGDVRNPVGTNLNAVTPSLIKALDAMGNTNSPSDTDFCFFLGGLTTTNLTDVKLSFAIMSEGNGGQFTTLTLLYSTSGILGTFTAFAVDTNLQSYTTYTLLTFNAPVATEGVSGSNLYFEFCFTGSANNAAGNNTFIDNIQVTAVPEPSTYISGLLGIVGLCWYQRRWLTRFLGLRPA
jgi:hypothetical protein